jgi:hypothetical protein
VAPRLGQPEGQAPAQGAGSADDRDWFRGAHGRATLPGTLEVQ